MCLQKKRRENPTLRTDPNDEMVGLFVLALARVVMPEHESTLTKAMDTSPGAVAARVSLGKACRGAMKNISATSGKPV